MDDSPILELHSMADPDAHHTILLGDFNIHHSQWGGDVVERNDRMAWELVSQTDSMGLKLATATGLTTWQDRGQRGTTIDLTFVSEELHNRLLRCDVDEEGDMASDHKPIVTELDMTPVLEQRAPRWSWKQVDQEALQGYMEALVPPWEFLSRADLDAYASYLHQFVCDMAFKHGRQVKSNKGSKSWWTPKVAKAVQEYRDTRQLTGRCYCSLFGHYWCL